MIRASSRVSRIESDAARIVAWLALAAVLGCGQDERLLVVDVQTDLVPGAEFVAVRSSLGSGEIEIRTVTLVDDFTSSRRVAAFARIPAVTAELRVELLDAAERPLLVRDVTLDVSGTTAARVVMSRSCLDRDCGPLETCHGGQCVSRLCSPLNPDECGTPACGNDDNCEASAPCADAVCSDGACLEVGRQNRCPFGRYCDPLLGCRQVESASDGGTPDAALPDAGSVEPCEGMGRDFYVDPQLGDDSLTGLSPFEPHATINRSILAAVEGDCINLRAGTHRGDVATQRAGTAERPITLRGPPEAVVHGDLRRKQYRGSCRA